MLKLILKILIMEGIFIIEEIDVNIMYLEMLRIMRLDGNNYQEPHHQEL